MAGLDRYRIVRPLGAGGHADVYEALAEGDHGFQRRVALKRLRLEEAEDPDALSAFIDEARLAGQLHHSNIVSVLDFGVADGMPFQVLELVDGVDAGLLISSTRKAGGSIPIDVALAVTLEIARALAYAHEAKGPDGQLLELVHRDVKPSNILISVFGDTKLGDFGIARARLRLSKTRPGLALGSFGYMAPEQWLGGQVDARTDVFALGCVLHALLTGDTPLASEDARAELLRDGRVNLSAPLPEDLRTLLGQALAKEKRDRPSSASAFQSAIGRALANQPGGDPRARLADLVKNLREPSKPSAAAGLFDLELLLGSDPAVRRFASVAAGTEKQGPDGLPTVIRAIPSTSEERTAIALRWGRAQSAITDHGAAPPISFHADEPTPSLSITPLLTMRTPTPTATIPLQITVDRRPRSRRLLLVAIAACIGAGIVIGAALSDRPDVSPAAPPPLTAPPELGVAPIVPRVEPRVADVEAAELPTIKSPARRIRTKKPTQLDPESSAGEPASTIDPLPLELAKVAALLEAAPARLPTDTLRSFEDRYFELTEREARIADRAQREALTEQVSRLRAELVAATH